MGTVHTILNGRIAIFEETEGIEFATQPKDRRKSTKDKDGLPVNKVTWDDLGKFIRKLTDLEAEYLYEKLIRTNEGRA